MGKMMATNNQCCTQILKKANLSNTKTRQAILRFLMENNGPFSINEIHEHISHCDCTTVYRCVKKFEEYHIVEKCDFGDHIARYEYKGDHHHHHIMCRICRKIEIVEYCFVKEMEKILEKQGYKDVSHKLEFFGICKACQEKA